MIILTTFLTIGFVTTSIILCWLSDKYSETLDELEYYKNKLNKKGEYKNVLQSYKGPNKKNTKAY